MTNTATLYERIANELRYAYDYYDSVAFGFITEAVENTLNDFGGGIRALDEIHKHITENYI